MLKTALAVFVAMIMLTLVFAYAEDIDLTTFTDEELNGLEKAIAMERQSRNAVTNDDTAEEDGPAEEHETAEAIVEFKPLHINEYNENNKPLQEKLKELKYLKGAADGIFGPKTEAALQALQSDLGWEQTGVINSEAELDAILALQIGDGKNLVWDGRFEDSDNYWQTWGKPTLCDIIEQKGKSWMHLISSGTHWEGLMQDVNRRSGENEVAELNAGTQYTMSFKAFGTTESVGKTFNLGIHNISLVDSTVQEQYWTPVFALTEEPQTYTFRFVPNVEGTFRIMVGTGQEDVIEAYFTDVKLESGFVATDWTPAP